MPEETVGAKALWLLDMEKGCKWHERVRGRVDPGLYVTWWAVIRPLDLYQEQWDFAAAF